MTYELVSNTHTDWHGHPMVCYYASWRSTAPSAQLHNLAPFPQPAASYSLSPDTLASTSTSISISTSTCTSIISTNTCATPHGTNPRDSEPHARRRRRRGCQCKLLPEASIGPDGPKWQPPMEEIIATTIGTHTGRRIAPPPHGVTTQTLPFHGTSRLIPIAPEPATIMFLESRLFMPSILKTNAPNIELPK